MDISAYILRVLRILRRRVSVGEKVQIDWWMRRISDLRAEAPAASQVPALESET